MRAMQHEQGKTAPLASPPLLDPRRHALFLDLDGTLLELQERPHAVHASVELRDLLRRASAAMSGAIAVITGRTISDADTILDGALSFIAGVHGYEMQRGANLVHAEALLTRLDAARSDVRELLREHGIPALVEDKGASLALHYRHAPESGADVRRIAAHIASYGIRTVLLDIVPPGETSSDPAKRNAFAARGLSGALAARPAAFVRAEGAALIEVGNFDDDLARIADCDWIIEVVVERMDIKKSLLAKVEQHWKPGAIVTKLGPGRICSGGSPVSPQYASSQPKSESGSPSVAISQSRMASSRAGPSADITTLSSL